MQRAAAHAARRAGISLRVVDVDVDHAAAARYGTEVPILLIPGGGVLRGGATSAAIAEAFRRALPGAPRDGQWLAILDRIRARVAAALTGRQQKRRARS